jgi:hypothetical protein
MKMAQYEKTGWHQFSIFYLAHLMPGFSIHFVGLQKMIYIKLYTYIIVSLYLLLYNKTTGRKAQASRARCIE